MATLETLAVKKGRWRKSSGGAGKGGRDGGQADDLAGSSAPEEGSGHGGEWHRASAAVSLSFLSVISSFYW